MDKSRLLNIWFKKQFESFKGTMHTNSNIDINKEFNLLSPQDFVYHGSIWDLPNGSWFLNLKENKKNHIFLTFHPKIAEYYALRKMDRGKIPIIFKIKMIKSLNIFSCTKKFCQKYFDEKLLGKIIGFEGEINLFEEIKNKIEDVNGISRGGTIEYQQRGFQYTDLMIFDVNYLDCFEIKIFNVKIGKWHKFVKIPKNIDNIHKLKRFLKKIGPYELD